MTEPTSTSAELSGRRRLVTVTAAIALAGVAIAGLGMVLGLRPVQTPTQECGSAFGFILDGRVNQYVDVRNLPPGVSRSAALSNNETPCQERAANRARPAGILVVGGGLVGLAAAAVEALVRARWRMKALS